MMNNETSTHVSTNTNEFYNMFTRCPVPRFDMNVQKHSIYLLYQNQFLFNHTFFQVICVLKWLEISQRKNIHQDQTYFSFSIDSLGEVDQ